MKVFGRCRQVSQDVLAGFISKYAPDPRLFGCILSAVGQRMDGQLMHNFT
jgi:hypothetical protein